MASAYFYSKDLAELDFGNWDLRDWFCGKKLNPKLYNDALTSTVMTKVFALSDEVALACLSRVSRMHRQRMKVYSERLFKLYQMPMQIPGQSSQSATTASSQEAVSDWVLVGDNASTGNSKGFQYTTFGTTPVFTEELRKNVDAMQSVLQKLHAIRVHLNGLKPLDIFNRYASKDNGGRQDSMNLVTWLASEVIRSYRVVKMVTDSESPGLKEIINPESREMHEAYLALELALKLRAYVQNEDHNEYLGVNGNPLRFVWKMYGQCGNIDVTSPVYPSYKKVVLLLIKYGAWTWHTWGQAKTLKDLGIRDIDVAPAGAAASTPATKTGSLTAAEKAHEARRGVVKDFLTADPKDFSATATAGKEPEEKPTDSAQRLTDDDAFTALVADYLKETPASTVGTATTSSAVDHKS